MKTKPTPTSNLYERMGAAHFLPGLTRAIEILVNERDQLVRMIGDGLQLTSGVTLNLEPHTTPNKNHGVASYWAKFTPEERSAEMTRRYKKTLAKQDEGKAPAKVVTKKRSWWSSLTPEQKEAHLKKQAAGLKKAFAAKRKTAAKQLVNGHTKEVRAAA